MDELSAHDPCATEYVIEIEPEVRLWLVNLSKKDYFRELRFDLGSNRDAVRIPYWLAPGRRIVLLTVFRKTRQREDAEVARAKKARAVCQAEHRPAHDEFTREFKEGE
jgi:hypothetical protein